jgi:3-hydroxymyristoyl/3-hydroxydecanoyl-(acyl carrier protein) dehydratase
MADRFSAFSFVDRILAITPGTRGDGRFAVPAGLSHFPPCLVAEAVGQLAAWVAMAQLEFRRRPVAGLAGEVGILGRVAPGQILDLVIELESCDPDAVSYGGRARVGDAPVVELSRCVGPMLPLEEFDAPEAVREHFEILCGPGATPDRFRGIAEPELVLTDRDPGRWLRAAMHVPAVSEPFFADHFPRRPVFPGTLLLDAQMRLALRLAADVLRPGPRACLQPLRAADIKLRSFIQPGQVMELKAETLSETRGGVAIAIVGRMGGKQVSTGRVEVVQRETS